MDLTPIESSLLCFERKASKHIYLLMSFLSLIYFLKDILNRYRANLARLYAEVCGGWWPGPILYRLQTSSILTVLSAAPASSEGTRRHGATYCDARPVMIVTCPVSMLLHLHLQLCGTA